MEDGSTTCIKEETQESMVEENKESEQVLDHNETDSTSNALMEKDLLKKLEEQNKLLESDSRYRQRINTSFSPTKIDKSVRAKKTRSADLDDLPASFMEQEETAPNNHSVENSLSSTEEPLPCKEDETKEETTVLNQWGDVMKNWDDIWKKNVKVIHNLVRKGIPGPLRGLAWQMLVGQQVTELKDKYPSLITETSPFEKSIQRDLARTFPDHSFFKDKDGPGQESLLNMMKAYSLYDREVGYCQGSLFIAGVLLMHMPEEDAFCVFVHLMDQYKLREIYKPTMADLSIRFYQLSSLVEEFFPKLDIHFRALGFHTSMYSSPWFLTMFASTLPLSVVFRIMDVFLIDGVEIIFRIGLALLERSHDQLLQLDMEDMTKHFQREVKSMKEADCNDLFEKAFKIKLSGKKLKKLEKEYLHKKEKQATENSQLIRLQDDNVELDKRVIALEKECAALADRLLQEQVGRKRENEEVSALRTELTQLRKKVAVFEKQDSQTHNTHETSKELRNRAVSDPLLRINVNHSPILKGSLFNDIKEDDEQINDSAIPESPSPVSSPIVDTASILKELATVKIEKVECMDLLERKSMEFKKLQQKHNKLQSELEKVTVKLKKLKKSKKSKNSFVCPNCGTKSKSKFFSNAGASDSSIYTEEEDETDGQYREILAGLKDMLDNPLSPVSPDNKDVSVNDNCMELKVTQV